MKDTVVFSIASKNYLAYARTFFDSIIGIHEEELDYVLLLTDEVNGEFDPLKEKFSIIEARGVGIKAFVKMSFMYDIVEFNTAVKPFFIRWLLDKGYKNVIYFDPDIMVFRRLDFIIEQLKKHSVILTPHITEPHPSDEKLKPLDESQLMYGVFNLGFIALSNSSEAYELVAWWARKLESMCLDDLGNGLFVDQKWMDLAPCFYDSLLVLRNKGYNMAWWNLQERRLDRGRFVNGIEPLIFYHFSSLDLNNLNAIAKFQKKFTFESRPDLIELFNTYKAKVIANGHDTARLWMYRYGSYDNGVKIGYFARRLYPLVSDKYQNPYSTATGSYYELLCKKRLIEKEGQTTITKDSLGNKLRYMNTLMKMTARMLGPVKYRSLMKYFKKISSINTQGFLLD